MSRLGQPYRCDVCGKLRENDANHWWLVWAADVLVNSSVVLCVGDWDSSRAEQPEIRHARGQECTMKLVERWLTTRSFEPASSRPVSSPRKDGPDEA